MMERKSARIGIFASRPSRTSRNFCVPDAHGYCPTCADEALPATITRIGADQWTATVEMSGELSEVDVSLIEGVRIGQVVLVHGGVAIGSLEPEEKE